MMKFILPVILIGISISVFFVFTNPLYTDVGLKRAQVAAYDEALTNEKSFENERDKLTEKLNSINPLNIERLQRLLPDNIDNIRLILEIGKVALPYGMVLKDVKYNATPESETTAGAGTVVGGAGVVLVPEKDFGIWDLEFSTTGTYNNFLNFIRDLENNLRIVDISSIEFSSDSGDPKAPASDSYKYDFKIKTYWLKG